MTAKINRSASANVTEELIRLSAGLKSPDDINADLKQAIEKAVLVND